MGCAVSFPYLVDPNIVGRNQECTDLLFSLSLNSADLDILFTAFLDIDADDSGTIRFDELFAYFRVEPTKFNETVFGYCDVDQRGYLTFLDFVVGIWLFLTVDQSELGAYAFILFDSDCTGLLDSEEILNLIHVIHNKTTIQNKAVNHVINELKESKEIFTCEKFQNWTRTHLSLLEPAQSLQINLRKHLIGETYWDQKLSFRKSHKEYQNLSRIYDLRKKVYQIQRKQVLTLLEERILARREGELVGMQSRNKGQRTTALLEYFQLSRPNGGQSHKTKDKLGLTGKARERVRDRKRGEQKRKEPEKRYRVSEEDGDQEQVQENQIEENLSEEEEKEKKDSEEKNDSDKNDILVAMGSGSSKDPKHSHKQLNETEQDKESRMNQFKDVCNLPEKQRRRRSSFLVRPNLVLKKEAARKAIEDKGKKGIRTKKGRITPYTIEENEES
jgi:hypothetical protein